MARYFFHTEDGVAHRDTEGAELPTDRAAKLAAIEFLGELLAERPAVLGSGHRLVLEVTDATGRVTFSVQAGVITDVPD